MTFLFESFIATGKAEGITYFLVRCYKTDSGKHARQIYSGYGHSDEGDGPKCFVHETPFYRASEEVADIATKHRLSAHGIEPSLWIKEQP